MTLAVDLSLNPTSGKVGTQGLSLWPVFALALLATLAISLPTLTDPLIRHDDYPAFFAEADAFWPKTLHEGRWINYVWHLREVVTPAWFNFTIYQTLWALFAAATAVAAVGREGSLWFAAVLALIITVSPSASLIALWFNTLIPGLALVALYALLACTLSVRQHRALLPLFVTLTFMAYTTYPLLLLALCLARTERRSILDLTGLLTLFAASFVLAVLTTFALNWQVHGIFGVPPADWREGTPAHDLSSLLANVPLVLQSLADFVDRSTYGFAPAIFFHLGLLIAASLVLVRRAPQEALYLYAGLATGLALVVLQILKLGVITPPRAFIFAWVIYGIIIVRAALILHRDAADPRQILSKLVLLVAAFYLPLTFMQYSSHRDWQSDTRVIAERVALAPAPVFLTGSVGALPSAHTAFIQTETALLDRIRQLTGRKVAFCKTDPLGCSRAEAGEEGSLVPIITD